MTAVEFHGMTLGPLGDHDSLSDAVYLYGTDSETHPRQRQVRVPSDVAVIIDLDDEGCVLGIELLGNTGADP